MSIQTACPICLDLLDNTHYYQCKVCNSKFNKDCLLEWQNINNTCPICRSPFENCAPTIIQMNIEENEQILHDREFENFKDFLCLIFLSIVIFFITALFLIIMFAGFIFLSYNI